MTVIPDIDILLHAIIPHRGPVHSFLASLIVFIPIFIAYRKRAVPYFIALVQHSLIGDYLTGGQLQLFWPVTQQTYGIEMSIRSPLNIALESTLFIASIIVLLTTRDLFVLFQPHKSNLILSIPTFTVLLPTFLSYPLGVPTLLILPHVVYMVMFSAVILVELSRSLGFRSSENKSLALKKKA